MRRLRELEEENRRLKSIVADQALDVWALKNVLAKKRMRTAVKRKMVSQVIATQRHACRELRQRLRALETKNIGTVQPSASARARIRVSGDLTLTISQRRSSRSTTRLCARACDVSRA
jgi:hypothetical protein